jgi:hypothetical protein
LQQVNNTLPSNKQALFIGGLFALFVINVAFRPERVIYLNEVLALFGGIFYLKQLPNLWKIDWPLLLINFIIVYGGLRAIQSLTHTTYYYGYFRTLVLLYSIPCFFLGIEFVKRRKQLFDNRFLKILAFPLAIISIFFSGIEVAPAFFPLLFKNYKRTFLLSVVFTLLMPFFHHGHLTTLTMVIALLVLPWLLTKEKFKRAVFHPFTISLLVIIFFTGVITAYLHFKKAFFLEHYQAMPFFLNNDTSWRLMYWGYELTSKNFSQLLFGIGFGTPIFNIHNPHLHFIFGSNLAKWNEAHKVFPYALGTHNFLIDVFTRLGLVGLLPLLGFFILTLNQFRKLKLDHFTTCCFMAFVLVTIGALCNVVVATPLYAASFWIFVGIFYQSLKKET